MIFSEEQVKFMKKEMGVDLPFGLEFKMDRDTWRKIKDSAFMIEAEEARPDGYLNERCRVAVELCDKKFC